MTMTKIDAHPENVKQKSSLDRFLGYWTARKINPDVISYALKGDYIEYFTQLNGYKKRFQWSKTCEHMTTNKKTKKSTTHPAFKRLGFSREKQEDIPLIVSPLCEYHENFVFLVEGAPDLYSLLTADIQAIALKSKGAVRRKETSDALKTFCEKFPHITTCYILPDPDGWDSWTQHHVFWEHFEAVKFINILNVMSAAGIDGKDVNDAWKAIDDRERFLTLLHEHVVNVKEPPVSYNEIREKAEYHETSEELQSMIDSVVSRFSGEMMVDYAYKNAVKPSSGVQPIGDEVEIRSNDGFYIKPSTLEWRVYGKNAGGVGILTLASYLLYGVNSVTGKYFSMMFQQIADFAGVPLKQEKAQKVLSKKGQKDEFGEFWTLDVKGNYKLDRRQFLLWLESRGFGVMQFDKRLVFVRIKENVVSECLIEHGQVIDAKIEALTYIREQKFDAVENMLLTGHLQYFSTSALNVLQKFTPEFCRDTRESAFLFFKNCFVEIQQNDVITRQYSALNTYIWEKQILPREYHGIYSKAYDDIHQPEGDFFEFFECVTAKKISEDRKDYEINDSKIEAFISAYGYLLHGFKDKTEARSIYCVDGSLGKIDDDGRTGKSLFFESLKYLKNVVTENGKTWKPDDRFAYQNISHDTQIFFVDDLSKKFKVELIYPAVTGDLVIEEKNKPKMIIQFESSPKFGFTSNVEMIGEGDSDKARRCTLPFSRFFSLNYRPKDHFGHTFFDGWNDGEWQHFFDFAIYAVNFHLQKGLIDYEDEEQGRARLELQIPETALDMFIGLSRNIEHDKNDILKSLQADLPNVSKHLFTKWLKIFCVYWRGTEEAPEKLSFSERRTFKDGNRLHVFMFEKVG